MIRRTLLYTYCFEMPRPYDTTSNIECAVVTDSQRRLPV